MWALFGVGSGECSGHLKIQGLLEVEGLQDWRFSGTQGLLCSSFLGLLSFFGVRGYNILPQKELHRRVWVYPKPYLEGQGGFISRFGMGITGGVAWLVWVIRILTKSSWSSNYEGTYCLFGLHPK